MRKILLCHRIRARTVRAPEEKSGSLAHVKMKLDKLHSGLREGDIFCAHKLEEFGKELEKKKRMWKEDVKRTGNIETKLQANDEKPSVKAEREGKGRGEKLTTSFDGLFMGANAEMDYGKPVPALEPRLPAAEKERKRNTKGMVSATRLWEGARRSRTEQMIQRLV
ncbi:hypothetical protein K469DRAFT_695595 [Zopfia rhizophila CBS 207.26]|uniref:Uncharacterized protein n=1 Tax=Zopfia rhizophila CBS 207.26 TaxID=1314779 RepID=A0A6A6DJ61_9PEZI|nr:hypothetical protein K469DRAFT_695595 [Zopfia rhizophila CBS 207.26]